MRTLIINTALVLLAAMPSLDAFGQSSVGSYERIRVFGKSLEGNLRGETDSPEVSVYLPPGYAEEAERRYPVLYLLHGYSGTDESWFGENAFWDGRGAADRAIGGGRADEMIIVMPNCYNAFGGCMYANSAATGYWEDYVADDLVAYIDSHYRTIPDRSARGLAGHSMGGYGVWLIGMHRPDVFSALYSLSACCLDEYAPRGGERAAALEAIKTEEQLDRRALRTFAVTAAWSPNPNNPPFYLDLPTRDGEVVPEIAARFAVNSPQAMLPSHVNALRKMTAIMLDVGEQDGLIGANRTFSETLTRYGIEHTFETYEGDHVNRIEQRFEERVLPFFSRHLRKEP
ncbi:MAG TPA: alpha/beta fold hydrolase [Gammaproteobacteria bacterium]